MKSEMVFTSSGKIERVEMKNGSNIGQGVDITEEILELAFQYMKSQFDSKMPNGRFYGYGFGDQGTLAYLPEGVKIVRENR